MVIHPQLTKWFDEDYKIFKKLFDDIASIVKPYITSHQNSLDSDADPKDFMDVYLNEVSKTSDLKSSFHGQRGEESLISTMTDLFLAGTETTTSSLLWAILCLLHYPEVQAKGSSINYVSTFFKIFDTPSLGSPCNCMHQHTKDVAEKASH